MEIHLPHLRNFYVRKMRIKTGLGKDTKKTARPARGLFRPVLAVRIPKGFSPSAQGWRFFSQPWGNVKRQPWAGGRNPFGIYAAPNILSDGAFRPVLESEKAQEKLGLRHRVGHQSGILRKSLITLLSGHEFGNHG